VRRSSSAPLAGRVPAVGRDAATAVTVTTLFGLGALLALAPGTPIGLQSLLFGDVLAVSDGDLLAAAALALVVLGVLAAGHHALLAVGFDRAAAPALGRHPLVADLVLLALLALTLLVAVPALGNLLVVALLVGPAVAARALTRRLAPMLALAAAIAVAAGAAGLAASYHLRTAAGASIALALVVAPLMAAAVSGSRRSGRAA
jgi:ABC-type Mn2+/Zn2+ transport system permease subunit